MEIKLLSDMSFKALISAYNALDLRKNVINNWVILQISHQMHYNGGDYENMPKVWQHKTV